MLKTDHSVEQLTQEAIDFLSKHITVEQVILFGSHAYGMPRPDSDIDLAVISEDFAGMSLWEKIDLFAKTSMAVDSRLELVGFTKEEYLHSDPVSFLQMIKTKGKILSK